MVFGAISTGYTAVFGKDLGGIDHWPDSIRYIEDDSGKKVFIIRGIYNEEKKWDFWPQKGNSLMKRIKKFSDTDSLAIDIENLEAWFFTEKTPEEMLGLFKTLSIYTGFVPTFSELSARDCVSPKFDSSYFEEKSRFEIEGVGHLIEVPAEREKAKLHLRYAPQNYKAFQTNSVHELSVQYEEKTGFGISTCEVDSIPYSLLNAYSSYRKPDYAVGEYEIGVVGVAKLNETREHCKGHMEKALRIYNPAGECIWKTEEGLHGAQGVWARDLDNDGIWELLVLASDHGTRRLVVFGKSN